MNVCLYTCMCVLRMCVCVCNSCSYLTTLSQCTCYRTSNAGVILDDESVNSFSESKITLCVYFRYSSNSIPVKPVTI
jgi:hypothetical protein